MSTTGQETPTADSRGKPISVLVCPNCGARNRITPSERGAPHCSVCGKPLPWVVDATEATFEVETKASPTVVVDLWAPWCGPCRIVSPMLDELARRFDAMSIPTLVVMKDGQVVNRIVGALPRPQLEAQILPHLKPPRTQQTSNQEAATQ